MVPENRPDPAAWERYFSDLTASMVARRLDAWGMLAELRERVPSYSWSMPDVERLLAALERAHQTSKRIARMQVLHAVADHLAPLVQAQVAAASGLKRLVYRDKKTGKFVPVSDPAAVDQEIETIEIWEENPSTAAFIALMDRAIDKPIEHQEITGKDGAPIEIEATLMAGRLAKLNA